VRTITVTDRDDPDVAAYATMRDGALGALQRRDYGVFVVEGANPVRELVKSPYGIESLLIDQKRLALAEGVVGHLDVPVYVADRDLFRDIVKFRMTQGIVALGLRQAPLPLAATLAGARLVAAFEAINDHENMGVVARSARALGVDAIAYGPQCADPLYRRAVRVGMGHGLHVPFAHTDVWPAGVRQLADAGLRTVALALTDDAVPLDTLADGVPTAVLLGAEGPGLSDEAIAAADVVARIPMLEDVDSLNVGVAASIAFHVLGPAARRR
jgi:tRNA G18 (ribose-2'-O)-methylase SpoU